MIKYFDIFAGIGGFRSGLEKAGGFKCVGYCEIDKYAKKAYETLYDTEGEVFYDDARKIDPNEVDISDFKDSSDFYLYLSKFDDQSSEEISVNVTGKMIVQKNISKIPLKLPAFSSPERNPPIPAKISKYFISTNHLLPIFSIKKRLSLFQNLTVTLTY